MESTPFMTEKEDADRAAVWAGGWKDEMNREEAGLWVHLPGFESWLHLFPAR